MVLKFQDKLSTGRFLRLFIMFWFINVHGGMAQPELVKDINPAGSGFRGNEIVVFKGVMYFLANDGSTGFELWQSDGTANGTVLLKDINPGAAHANPQELTVAGDYLFFIATNATEGTELWRTDGTPEGTQIVADLIEGNNTSRPDQLTAANEKLFFVYPDPDSGLELFVVTGTGIPQRISDFRRFGGSNIDDITALGDQVYFRTDSDSDDDGFELYTSDGTEAGTRIVKDIWFGSNNDGDPQNITAIDSLLFFSAEDSRGVEPWISNGTTAGTNILKDLYTDQDANPKNFTKVGNKVFFAANEDNSELWVTDGTAANTTSIIDINSSSFNRQLENFTAGDGILYFSANTGDARRELWRSDGTTEGTYMVKDINPGSGGSIDTDVEWLYFNGRLYLTASDGINGIELLVSDGTEEGTQLVDINEGSFNSTPKFFTVLNNEIYFRAFTSSAGTELYKYRPTNAPPPVSKISGIVYQFNPDNTNDQSQRLEGVTVTNTFTSATTTTNANGEYEIEAEDGHQIRFTKDGYSSFLLLTNFDEDGTVYNIPLTAQASNITFNFDPNVLNENKPVGTVAGRFTSKDFDNLTYSLVSGEGDTDNGSFTINGQDQLIAQFSANFETKSTYSIRVRATNGVDNPAEEIFTINITDVNEISGFVYQFNPDDTNDTSQRLNGVTVTNTFTSATTTTNANGEYEIEAEDGHQVRFTRNGYSSFLLLTDFDSDGTVYNIPLTAEANNIIFSFEPAALNENEPTGTVAGTFTSSDFDNLTYNFVSGEGDADNGSFTINEQDQLIAQFSADFETKSTYSIRVRASNGNDNPAEEIFIISITDVNEPLSNIAINTTQITSAFNGGLLTTISVSDPEDKNDVVYSFVQGDNDNGLFFIDGDQVFALPGFSIDGREEIVLQIRATDEFGEGLSIEETFIIPVIELAALRLNVSPADGNFCTGEEIAFSVEVLNAVNTPVIEWIVNGQQVTPNDVDLQAGDQVEIRVTAIDAADQQQKTIYSGVIQVAINEAPPATITSFGFIITASEGASHDWYYQGELLPDTTQSIIAKEVGEYQVAVTTDQGCTSLSESLFMFVTGLDGESKIEVRAYPNPVSKTITIQFNRPLFQGKIQAHDVNGREVFNRVINEKSKFSVNVSHWKDGIYLFRIQTNYGTHHFKILKK